MKNRQVFCVGVLCILGLLLSACGGGGGGGDSGSSNITGKASGFSGQVSLSGTDLSTTVGDGEVFAFSGVPAGQRELRFTQGGASGLAAGETATLALNVPDNASINLGTVKINGNQAVPSQVAVQIFNSNSNANSNDDNGNDDDDDDNGNDDNGNDDNGNDDDNSNDDDDDDDDDNSNNGNGG